MRDQAINRVRSLLQPKQLHELERLRLDRDPGKFLDKLNELSASAGRRRNVFNTPFGEIKISAGPGLRKIINFNLTQRQAQYGQIPANRAFPFEDNRTGPILP